MFTILFFKILIKVHEFIILNLKNLKKKNCHHSNYVAQFGIVRYYMKSFHFR